MLFSVVSISIALRLIEIISVSPCRTVQQESRQALAHHVTGTEKSDFMPKANFDVIKHADVADVISHVGDTCRYVR